MLSQYGFDQQDAYAMRKGFSADHWLGTDSLGRDLWVRVWMGARVSLTIGLLAAGLNTVIGTVLGGFCGYYGGKFDMIVMRIIDVIYGIPSLIVCILVMVVLGSGVQSLIIAMVIVGWTGTCRFTRGEVYRLKEQEFVLAARVMGEPVFTIIMREIIPNIMGLLITNLAMAIPNAIFQEAFYRPGDLPAGGQLGRSGEGRDPYAAGGAPHAVRAGVLYLHDGAGVKPAGERPARRV